jgi:hypothetical protein
MELQAWPVFKPHRSNLNCLSSLWAGILAEMKDELSYKSLGKLKKRKSDAMDRIRAFDK